MASSYPYNPLSDVGRSVRKSLGITSGGEEAASTAGQASPMSPATKRFIGIPDPAALPMQKNLDIYNPYGAAPARSVLAAAPANPVMDIARKTLNGQPPQVSPLVNPVQPPPGGTALPSAPNARYPKPGSTFLNAGSPEQTKQYELARMGAMGNTRGTAQGEGYTFDGAAGDAARFMRPSPQSGTRGYGTAGLNPVMQGYTVNDPPDVGGPPKYLGPESGLGWKTRAKLYDTEMDSFSKATGSQVALDIEGMREAGAGARAILAARGENERNKQQQSQFETTNARETLNSASTRKLQDAQIEAAKAPKLQIIEQPGVGPDGITPIKTPYILDREGNARPAVNPQSDPLAMIKDDPQALAAFNKLSPKDQKVKLQQMRDRLSGSM